MTFVHGIGNKLPPDALLDAWERSLADAGGLDLGTRGITSSMVYWADVMYPEPSEASLESTSDLPHLETEVDVSFRDDGSPEEQDWANRFAESLGVDEVSDADDAPDSIGGDDDLERVPLPRGLKNRLMRTLLRDVHHYLFDSPHQPRADVQYAVQSEIRDRMVRSLQEGAEAEGPHVVVSHSMGTVIAYDCLKRVRDSPSVDALVTVGSPLGRDEIPAELKPGWSRNDGFPSERVAGEWVNVYDRLDPVVGIYPHLKYTYRKAGAQQVVDLNEQNWGTWRHDIAKYLHGPRLRAKLATLLGESD